MELTVDDEFVNLIPPLSKDEFEQLRDNILKEKRVLNPLLVWENIIVDGHHRFKVICDNPDIEYRIEQMYFVDKYEAIAWICYNQLGRRNLTPIQKTALLGRRYTSEKQTYGDIQRIIGTKEKQEFPSPHGEDLGKGKTSLRIAKQVGVGHATVERAESFVKGMDAAEEVLPGISREIISGQIKPNREQVAAIAKAPIEERRELAEKLRIRNKITEEEKQERAKRREMSDMIARLSAEHGNINKPKPGTSSYVKTLSDTVNMMIATCEVYIKDHPEVMSDEDYRKQTLEILSRFRVFVKEVEESEYE